MESNPQSALVAGRYEIRRALGTGGAGTVFQAWDTQLQRFVAVKRWNAPEPLADDREGTERLWREATTLAAIQHPGILTLHDFGVDADGPYVVTEFVDGETLDRVIANGPFDREAFGEAAQQILEALAAAHAAGLIHRDLKPQNIMRTRLASGAWQYKVLDFGLARFVNRPALQSLEGNTAIYGSILYIAPEQLRHQPLDARTDIYAAGCLFYYMLSGRNAVEGETIPELITSHLEHQVRPLAEWRTDLPPGLCDWVMKALAFAPEDRFSSAAVALAALGKVLPGIVHATSIRIGARNPAAEAAPARTTTPPPFLATARLNLPATPGKTGPVTVPVPARAPVWRRMVPIAAAGVLAVAAILAMRFWPRAEPAPAAPPAPPPAAAAVDSEWGIEPSAAEDIIARWPPSIPPARRPLIQQYYEQLRDLRIPKWGSIGAVLEHLAVIQFNAKFDPKEFRALANLTYHDESGRTLGELDIVVWNVRENRAEVVYEVVISDQLHRKATASRNQLRRFETALKEHQTTRILYPTDTARTFEPAQFEGARFEILGNQGALAAGFDSEVDLTRPEGDFLQRKLIDYRNDGTARF